MNKSTINSRIELAFRDLNAPDPSSLRAIASKYGLVESTLRRRWRGQTISQGAASSLYKQRLSLDQEEVLIRQINQLTNRGLPPTSSIVKNLAEAIIGGPVGKNWTGTFVRRNQDRLTSQYLRNIDSQRVNSEYAPSYEHFYELVTFNYSFLRFTWFQLMFKGQIY
jgi:transposase-like protein